MSRPFAEADTGLSPGDFDEIERAVMESARGRWFLAEYARRLHSAEAASLLAAMTRLQSAIVANQDELLQRLGAALAAGPAEDQPAPTPQQLTDRQMKYFRDDEGVFEPASGSPATSGHSRLIIRRVAEPPEASRDTESPGLPGNIAASVEPPPSSGPAPVAGEPPRRRIVIIRHKPGEEIDVPLQTNLAEAG